ncbi:hypothetical protein D9M73_194200 [compost metagenome]
MNTASRINQLQNSCGAIQAAWRDSPPRITPRNPLPASPMNIRAGGKFQTRKPAVTNASANGSQLSSLRPISQ